MNENRYYSLNLGSIEIKPSQQSFYRTWNRLHRLQRTIIIVILILLFLYILTHIEFHRSGLKQIDTNHKHEPNNRVPPKQEETIKKDEVVIDNKPPDPSIKGEKKSFNIRGPSNDRQEKVVEAFKHAWKGYKAHSWGQDELKPLSKTSSSWFNLGLTIIDSLDTIYLMNLKDIFAEAREWVANSLSLDSDRYNNLFEITIRIMGGLLSAYHLSGDEMFLVKAYDLGNRTLPAFNTHSSIPLSDVNLMRRSAKSPTWTTESSVSEVATLQIEFNDLTYLTGDKRFKEAVQKVSKVLHSLSKPDGLVPIYISTDSGRFVGSTITLGARGDSYYEYLLKQWIQTGAKMDPQDENYYLLEDWLTSYRGVRDKLIRHTVPHNYTFIGELLMGTFSPKMDHLVCFYPGNLALGYLYLSKTSHPKDELAEMLKIADELTETCYQMYAQMETGLSAEIAHFNYHDPNSKDLYVKEADRHNLLRPETVESLYYMFKVTHNKKYQEYGWKIFEAFEKYTKIESGGYSSISDVTNPGNVRFRDKMESFFLAETLKYFYLLFEDSENIDLNKWLINTEAHLISTF